MRPRVQIPGPRPISEYESRHPRLSWKSPGHSRVTISQGSNQRWLVGCRASASLARTYVHLREAKGLTGGLRRLQLLRPRVCRAEVALMANSFGIPPDIEHRLQVRDRLCVYCRTPMKAYPRTRGTRGDKATIEHLNHRPPFHWEDGLKRGGLEVLAVCCGRCNSSRGNKPLVAWFASPYCEERRINIRTVAPVVRRFLLRHPRG